MNILQSATFPKNQDYHAGEGISWSKFKRFLESSLQFHYLFGPEGVGVTETAPMTFGSYIHSLVLEPHMTTTEFQPRREMPWRSKPDKEAYVAWLVEIGSVTLQEIPNALEMKAEEVRALEKRVSKRFLPAPEWDKGCAIAKVLKPYFPDVRPGNVEAAFYAEIEGVLVKCKCDHIDDSGTIKDIKCCGQLDKWLSGLSYGDLLCGDAWYRMVIREATGILLPPIEYVGVATEEPFEVCVRSHLERDFPLAEARILDGLRRFKDCLHFGVWPGVDPTPEARKVEIRSYTKKTWERELEMDEDALAAYILESVE